MGSCNQCGKFGHRKGDCWEIESNRHKRPEGYRSTEQANVTLDRNDDDDDIEFVMCGLCLLADKDKDIHDETTLHDIVLTDEYADVIVTEIALIEKQTDQDADIDKGEVVLVGMEFPDSIRLLSDPNIWIGDTAASVHTSPYQHGLTPEGNAVKNGSITIGNGITEKTAMYGNIAETICNKHGTKVRRAKLTHVADSPNMKFNLCSLSKLFQDGWEMKGNEDFLVMERNNQTIKFYIKVMTATGVV
jgi:hypothetical protein